MRLKTLAAAAVAALVAPVAAFAAPATTFTSTLVTDSGAIADDANLVGKIQNLMNVTTSNGGAADWTNSAIRITLTTGTIHNATNAAVDTESGPNPGIWGIATLRGGPFDSFVNGKNNSAGTILGKLNADGSPGQPNPGSNPPFADGLIGANQTLVSVQWGNTTGGDTGTFSVGRFTLSPNAVGTFFGQTLDSTGGGVGVPFNGTIAGGVMSLTVIPEPASLGLLGLAATGLLARRRRLA